MTKLLSFRADSSCTRLDNVLFMNDGGFIEHVSQCNHCWQYNLLWYLSEKHDVCC